MNEPMSDATDLKPLLVKLISMVAEIAGEVTAIRGDVAEIKAIQLRHGSRLASLDARLDTDGQKLEGLIRP